MRAAWVLQGIGYMVLGLAVYYAIDLKTDPITAPLANVEPAMETNALIVQSPAFKHTERIPAKYTCDGDNVSPPLAIDNIPPGTVSLVLIVDDPDAPGATWDHWIMYDIPPDTSRIGEGSLPLGTSGKTSWGTTPYGGPCPPQGEHRYFFKVYALDTTLDLPEGVTKEEVLRATEGHTIGTGELMGTYIRM